MRGLLIAGAIALAAAVVVSAARDPAPYRVGQRTPRPLTARVEYSVPNPDRTALLRLRARESAPNQFTLDVTLLNDLAGRLANAFAPLNDPSLDPAAWRREAAELGLQFDDASVTEVQRRAAAGESAQIAQSVQNAIQRMARVPLVQWNETIELRTSLYAMMIDPDNPEGRREPVSQIIQCDSADAAERAAAMVVAEFPEPFRPSLQRSIATLLRGPDGLVRPLFRYDAEASRHAAERMGEQVPEQFDVYPRGAQLADAGTLSATEVALLTSEHAAAMLQAARSPLGVRGWVTVSQARAGLAFAIVFGFGAYLLRFRHFNQTMLGNPWLLITMLLALLMVARAVYVRTGIPEYAVGLLAFGAMLVALVGPLGAKTTLAGILCLLITMAANGGVGFLVTLLAVAGVLIGAIQEVRSRGRIVLVSLVAALTALLIGTAAGLLEGQPLGFVFWKCALRAAAATLAAGLLVEGILPLIERLFGVSTAMTLLEWCDANRPLMRMLAGEAPGTYNHSLMVGSLAEAAAEAIGAHGLLCRAGAYYHDIGKTNNPDYFIENQQVGGSRHAKLNPALSHLVIINHVKNGIEMADEYGVPESLHPFIAEHHGTTVVEYFFVQATKARRDDEPEVSETEFRYPGPKPQSRETAILMICDAVEGTVRAMSEPTPARIEETVARVVQRRLIDGQFDECELTFRELATIQKAVVKALNSVYHARIVYPERPEADDDEAEPDEKSQAAPRAKIATEAPAPQPEPNSRASRESQPASATTNTP